MNYIDGVKRDVLGHVIKIVAVWEGKSIPFIPQGNKMVRADNDLSNRPNLPSDIYGLIYSQVISVYKDGQKKAKSQKLFWLLESLVKVGVKVMGRGKMEISRWDKKLREEPRLIEQIVDDLPTAIRMQDHILDGYRTDIQLEESEISRLASIDLIINQANTLLTSWLSANADDKTKLQQELAQVVLCLENCRNEYKVATREQASAIVPLKDSRGKPNPGAFAARTIAALDRLTKRLNELNVIMPYIAMRKEMLIFTQRWMNISLAKALAKIRGLSRQRTFVGKGALHEVKYVKQEIEQILLICNDLVIAPYYQTALKVKRILNAVRKTIGAEDFDPEKALTKINKAILVLSVLSAITQLNGGNGHETHRKN